MSGQTLELSLPVKVWRLGAALVQRASRTGLRSVLLVLRRRLSVYWYEWRLGVCTTGWISQKSISTNPLCLDYEPFDYETIFTTLSDLQIDPNRDVLLDYGAGKGRVLAVAAQFPFKRVLGVELSPYLADIGRQNMNSLRGRVCSEPVEIVTGDATTFEVPADVTVIFLFNPFCGEVLDAVVRRVEERVRASPRILRVIHTRFRSSAESFGASPFFRRIGEIPLIGREDMISEVFSSEEPAR